MLARAGEGAPEGLWLRAERQTGGRGRMGRNWESPTGNLHCSTIVRLRAGDPPPATLAFVAAVSIWRAIDVLLPGRSIIKWPNDVLIDGAKLCGMLLERADDAIIVGIGVNVMAHPDLPDRRTTSLWAQGAVEIDAGALLERVAAEFDAQLHQWRAFGFAPIRTAWLAAAHPPGTLLRVSLPDGGVLEGGFGGLESDGALILALADGSSHAIHAADVFLL